MRSARYGIFRAGPLQREARLFFCTCREAARFCQQWPGFGIPAAAGGEYHVAILDLATRAAAYATVNTQMHFRVELDVFLGPLDLLLYLVRKQELDVVEIPISSVTEQFLTYLSVLAEIDVNAVGEFLEMASTLVEIKSRQVLPGDEEVSEELEDPRHDLVRRLLEFKHFRDAAHMLEERGRKWSERYSRRANDVPARSRAAELPPIHEVELWDLVSAFGRVLKSRFPSGGPESIRSDETPIHVYMQRIGTRLAREGRVAFTEFFEEVVQRPTLVGMFLAVLELVRHQHARATQPEMFGEIWLEPGDEPLPSELAVVSSYDHADPTSEAA